MAIVSTILGQTDGHLARAVAGAEAYKLDAGRKPDSASKLLWRR